MIQLLLLFRPTSAAPCNLIRLELSPDASAALELSKAEVQAQAMERSKSRTSATASMAKASYFRTSIPDIGFLRSSAAADKQI